MLVWFILFLFFLTGAVEYFTYFTLYTHILMNYILFNNNINFAKIIFIMIFYINFYQFNSIVIYGSSIIYVIFYFLYKKAIKNFYRLSFIYNKNIKYLVLGILFCLFFFSFYLIEYLNLTSLYSSIFYNAIINIVILILLRSF